MTNHPMTPSPSQLDQWEMVARATTDRYLFNEPAIRAGHFGVVHRKALRLAFAAGADQELQSCCEWLTEQTCFHPESDLIKDLRAARRPKPPSLKEQALKALHTSVDLDDFPKQYDTIRKALEALPE